MKRSLTTALTISFIAILAGAGRALAQDASDQTGLTSAITTAEGEARFVHQSPQGPTQAFVREYDGKSYDVGEFDFLLRSGWEKALLDLNVKDLNSGNDSGSLDFSLGSSINLKGDFDVLTHRLANQQDGLVINNQWSPNTAHTEQSAGQTAQDAIKRTLQEQELTLSLPGSPEYRLFAGNWLQTKRGSRPVTANNVVYQDTIDWFTRENNFGLDLDIGQHGQAYYEFAFRKVDDKTDSTTIPAPRAVAVAAPQDVTTHKVAFRYNPTQSLSLAAALSTRERDNQSNGLKQYNYSGNLSASYRPTKDLSFSARLYEHATQVKEQTVYVGQVPDMDFMFVKADIEARYTGMPGQTWTAAYKPEYTHRANAQLWAETFGAATYQNVTVAAVNSQLNAPAGDDTKHTFQGGLTLALPLDMELDLKENYLMANRAAYENSPTLSNDQSVALTIPLPERLYWTSSLDNSRSENQRSNLTAFKSQSDTIMTGLTWSAPKGSLSFNYAYERGTDNIDAWFGLTNAARGGGTVKNLIDYPTAPYTYQNNVLSASATARPTQKLTLNGDVSYTDSNGAFLISQVFDPYFQAPYAGQTAQSLNPTDVRILRWGFGARYMLTKNLSARAGFKQESWIDRFNSANDGRDNIFNVGLNAAF